MNAGIEVRGLTKRYGRTPAVTDLSFVVRPGRVTGFLGPNGAGKSTTMRLILGLDHPDSGQTMINGRHYSRIRRPLTQVGAFLGDSWTHPNLTSEAHLRWLAAANGISRARVSEVLEQVGLAGAARRRTGGFSLGMQQRLGIAAALLGDPGTLVFDEPVNGLDPEGIVWIRELIKSLAGEGRTVLVSSHLLSEMTQTADELIVIGKGRLIMHGSTKEFLAEATNQTVRVRSPQADRLVSVLTRQQVDVDYQDGTVFALGVDASLIGEIAAAEGIVLHELVQESDPLEQAFLRLTEGAVTFHSEAVR